MQAKIGFDEILRKVLIIENTRNYLDSPPQKHNLESQENRPLEQSAGASLSIVRHKMKGVPV